MGPVSDRNAHEETEPVGAARPLIRRAGEGPPHHVFDGWDLLNWELMGIGPASSRRPNELAVPMPPITAD